MNWLGKLIQPNIKKTDTVLDLGCGIMQATTDVLGEKGNLKCKSILGVDMHLKYLDRIKSNYSTIQTEVVNTKLFPDKSYDAVICLDVLEHIETNSALKLIGEMERIARKIVIIYTPREFHKNEEHIDDVWGMGKNPSQEHLSFISQEQFKKLGFKVNTTEIDHNTLAIKKLNYTPSGKVGFLKNIISKLKR